MSARRPALKLTRARGAAVLVMAVVAGVSGCATKTQTGALVGGAGGAAAGAAVGSASGNAGKGALIGGAVGLIGGGLVGNSMDQADDKAERETARRDAADDRSPKWHDRYASADARVTREDVVTWTRQGKSDDVIIDRIERSDAVFRLTAGDEDRLREQGVSTTVIHTMKGTERR